MKSLILALTLSLALTANAATNNVGDDTSGIVTPNIATGMSAHYGWTNFPNGDMAVCIKPKGEWNWNRDLCNNPAMKGDNNQGWTTIKDAIPAGRTYVGFRIVSQGSSRKLEIYWK